jgi:hypothetical protein
MNATNAEIKDCLDLTNWSALERLVNAAMSRGLANVDAS